MVTGFTRSTHPFSLKNPRLSLTQKLLSFSLPTLLLFAFIHFYFFPLTSTKTLQNQTSLIYTTQVQKAQHPPNAEPSQPAKCDLSDGQWVPDPSGPQYNGSCVTIKEGQNCELHGRPDKAYLNWRWKPKQCDLPRFEPATFLRLLRHKTIAFVGDSMARNQLESLLCLLSGSFQSLLVYQDGPENKFRRWYFPTADVNISLYWSPFLVKGEEKSAEFNYNRLYLDSPDPKWLSDLRRMDVVLFSVGHWFLHPAVYYQKNKILGCHYCPDLNHTEIGFYGVLQKAMRTTLRTVLDQGRRIDTVVTTFSPAHFEGEWDKAGACPRKEPFKEGERVVEGMNGEMRKIEIDEVEAVKKEGLELGVRFEALDVTKPALMRPDGHPGPYMNSFPFASGVKTDRVQNDCVHWCLPGPVDTWNEMLLELVKRWKAEGREQ